jgi:hypothetical protein
MKWTQMVEAARGRHGVTSEDSDTERVVFVPKRHGPPKCRCVSTKPHGSTFQKTVNLKVLKYLRAIIF